MILNGNQRGGGLKLAAHLMNVVENDHVEVHELRGFCSQTLRGALQETDAVAKGTQCKQYLFSLSLSPPETERVPIAEFGAAVAEVEKKLGLVGQPRAIVFHEKNGRRQRQPRPGPCRRTDAAGQSQMRKDRRRRPIKPATNRTQRLSLLPPIPHLRLLLVSVKRPRAVLHDQHSISQED
ncbi:hypothetical protein [uncultured Roseobacter sp.]|uniref:hypothetical protein n=1 Tax=uncultured Roseobacter sp. TaxID=114847 RepID=UPI0026355A13|nr:hypothetical protein [uncultured Roseobacter sp.]